MSGSCRGTVLNVSRFGCKLQDAEGLCDAVVGGADAGHDEGVGGASQRVAQEAGDLGVAVRNVGAVAAAAAPVPAGVREGADDVPQSQQARVDVDGLFELRTSVARFGRTLGAREVDEAEFGGDGVVGTGLAELKCEDDVRAAGVLVHPRGTGVPQGIARLHDAQQLLR